MSASWYPAYVGLGSNLKNPRAQIEHALEALKQLPRTRLILVSPLYLSSPLGETSQPDFINAVAGLLTQLDAHALLGELRALERRFGRPEKRDKWGPRILDLDLLVYATTRCNTQVLTLPHPGIVERNFVLYPLAQIAPELDVPGLGRVAALARRVAPGGIQRLN